MELLKYEFIRHALYASVLISVACGVIGTYVVIKRITFISGGISHASLGGIGLGYLLGVNPIVTAIPFSLLSAVCIGIINRRLKVAEDTAIGILWTVGISLGIIFIDLSPGYAPDLMSYLFGNILTVPTGELVVMLVLDLIIISTVGIFHREFLAISFDEEYSSAIGISTERLYFLLLCLIALSVVVLIKAVGVIMVIALLTIPAAISKRFTYNIGKLFLLSTLTGVCCTVAGLWVSYMLDLASGATIVLGLGTVFLTVSLVKN